MKYLNQDIIENSGHNSNNNDLDITFGPRKFSLSPNSTTNSPQIIFENNPILLQSNIIVSDVAISKF